MIFYYSKYMIRITFDIQWIHLTDGFYENISNYIIEYNWKWHISGKLSESVSFKYDWIVTYGNSIRLCTGKLLQQSRNKYFSIP